MNIDCGIAANFLLVHLLVIPKSRILDYAYIKATNTSPSEALTEVDEVAKRMRSPLSSPPLFAPSSYFCYHPPSPLPVVAPEDVEVRNAQRKKSRVVVNNSVPIQ